MLHEDFDFIYTTESEKTKDPRPRPKTKGQRPKTKGQRPKTKHQLSKVFNQHNISRSRKAVRRDSAVARDRKGVRHRLGAQTLQADVDVEHIVEASWPEVVAVGGDAREAEVLQSMRRSSRPTGDRAGGIALTRSNPWRSQCLRPFQLSSALRG